MKGWSTYSFWGLMLVPLASTLAQAQPRVLGSFPADSAASASYRLVRGEPCDERMCPARIVLMADGGAVGSVTLEWGFLTGHEPKRDEEGCWFTRIEGVHLETCPSLVRLDAGRNGLLVNQTAGWDHVAKSQELYAPVGDSLAKIWEQGSSMGRTYKSAWVTDTNSDGIDEIVTRTEHHAYLPEQADYWYLNTLVWDPTRETIARANDSERVQPTYAAIVGSFETLAEAREQREVLDRITRPSGRPGSCLPGFLILESSDYEMLSPGWFIIAYMTDDRDRAFEELEEAKACKPVIEGYVKRAE